MIYPADVEYASEPYLGLPPMAEYADHLAIERVLLEALAWTLWHDTPQGVDLVRHVEATAGQLPAEARSLLASLQAEMDVPGSDVAGPDVPGPAQPARSGDLAAGKHPLPGKHRSS